MYNVDVDGSSLLHLAVNSGVLGVRMFISIDHRFASCFYLEISVRNGPAISRITRNKDNPTQHGIP